MKKPIYLIKIQNTIIAILLFFFTSCSDNESEKMYEIAFRSSLQEAYTEQDILISDLSLGVSSRNWFFEDGYPGKSTAPELKVQFLKSGLKKCRLEVIYTNGQIESKEFTIQINAQLKGEINYTDTTKMGCLPVDKDLLFDVTNIKGSVTSFRWEFEGGTPKVSNNKSEYVRWNNPGIYNVKLILKNDNENLEMETSKKIIVGPYPLLKSIEENKYDPYSFEFGSIGDWILWFNTNQTNERCQIFSPGANNTDNCMKIDLSGMTGNWTLQHKNCWVTNAHLKKNNKYEVSFWAKADKINTEIPSKINRLRLINSINQDLYNESFDTTPIVSWDAYWPNTTFEEQAEKDVLNMGPAQIPALTDSWSKFHFNFEVDELNPNNILLNTYLFLMFQPDKSNIKNLYIDEVQINLIEK